nr:Heat shock protein DnaJ domain containing protein [Haemonchus contortus]
MAQFCANNRDVICFLVTKHSWKGKYKRIFSIGTLAITTYNPQTLEITNQWQYEDFIAIKPSPRNASSDSKQDEFVIHVRHKGKRDTMRFSSDYTAHIISECLQFNSKFSERNMEPVAVNAYKHSWADRRLPVILRANAAAIEQVDSRGVVIQTYPYRRIRKILKVSDCPGGFIIDVGDHHRRHLFASTSCDDFLKDVRRIAADHIGVIVPITKEAATLDEFALTRLGLCSRDDHITSYAEFKVQKHTRRHEQPVRRLLCLTETCIVERDPASYAVVCATPLEQIVCLVRSEKDPQQFVIEYTSGDGRVYSAAERDLIIASMVDGARAAGNEQVFVTSHRFDNALRLLPHGIILDEDGESQCMRHVIAPPPGLKRSDLIRRFNANIPYTGLTYSVSQEGFFTENKGKIIVGALEAVLGECYDKEDPNYVYKCEAQLQCLRRLFASKSGFQAFTEVAGVREKLGTLVIRVLSYKNEAIDYATVEALCALMHPMHNQYELRTEQLNKQSLLSSTKFVEHLLDLIVNHVDKQRQRPVVLRKRRQRVRNSVNWKLFAYQFGRDHSQADLLWNEKTREEFRLSIEGELRALLNEKEQAPTDMPISWNHTEFQTRYPSLQDEVKIGDYYLRLLLQEADESATPIHNPTEFFNNVYHRFLLSSRSEMRCLCLRAMAVTYGRHHMTIGPFEDARHFVSMLAKCTNAAERDHFILLLSKLVLNKDNVRELIGSSLLPILVDLAVLAHLHVQRAKVQNQSNVIEASADQLSEGNSAEWYYATTDNNKERLGPFSFEKMKTLYAEKKIFEKTAVWAAGMEKWEPLSKVPQFRWTVCLGHQQMGTPLYNFTQLCALCLDIMIQMCEFFPSRDDNNSVVRPMPQVKKSLTEPVLLYQVVQLLLTYDPTIVQRVATLVHLVMQDNPFLPRLYLSGVFFFILMYNGSNVLPIARFLHYTHKKQAFRTALPQLEGTSQSILAPLLPAAAIFYLDEYGPDKYAEVFLGEFDNPEIIWSTQMRRHLIERIAIHVSDFSNRLTSNVKALYQYCPIPLIDYPELQNELFCYVYYLRHLCDRQRFPDWEIRDPIPFLRACLAAWFEELEKKPPVMSVEQARETLGLNTMEDGWQDTSVIRRAYFKLAARYHPDKNPEGREMFERINTAYELLSSDAGRSSMPDPHRIVLFLQAQSIIYSRHSQELSAYKYAGYGQLIRTIDLEAKNTALFQEGGGALLSAAVELANHTLMSSALNAEQLRREQGLEALQVAFDRCVPVITESSTPTDMAVQVCEHICNCFATAASFEACRQRIAEMPTVFGNICRLLQFPHLPRLSSAAAQCVCSMAVDTLLQTQLFQQGVLWQLVPHLFHYDFTLDEGGVSHSEESNKQAMANRLARVSCEALACLAGFREATPDNDGVQNSLRALLTPYVCRCMRTESNDMVLKTLNCNTEDPYLIWDNGTRAEVLEFVERHRTSREQTSELFGAEFQLSIHAKELIVGDIFVRIYNEQPTFVLHEPKKVAMDLLDFMGRHAPELTGQLKKPANGDLIEIDWSCTNANKMSTDEKVVMCTEALANLISANPGVEILLIGHFNLIIAYLRARLHPNIQLATLKLLSLAVANRECVQDLSNLHVCSSLFILMRDRREARVLILNTLIALSSNGQIVKEMLDYGGLLYILSVLCSSESDPGERLLAAELLTKLQSDKLTGPRWTRFITKYLPPIFADALRDSPNTAITMFDSTNENPELIWNETTRVKVRQIIERGADELYRLQSSNPEHKWDTGSLTDNTCAYADSVTGELVVGGVFVRLYVANPAWAVRHPRQFATELIEKVLELMNKPSADLTLVTTAFIELLRNFPNTADQLPAQGYLPQFSKAMSARDPQTSRSAILILQQLAENHYCADALSRINCIEGIMTSMKNQPTLMHESAHALKCLMRRNNGDLAAQMLSTKMVDYLLEVLGSDLPGVSNSPAARAEIVDALKSACLDLQVGEKISEILNRSPIWAQYRDQRHDLFLPAQRTQAITGTSTGVAGYLTEGMFSPPPLHTQPPPMERSGL